MIQSAFEDRFGKKNNSKIHTIVKKIDGLNARTLNWKFQKLVKNYKLPLSDGEIIRFKNIRDSLAHTLSFPQESQKIDDWKFLVTLLDKIVLGLFKYEGKYNNFHKGNESVFKLTS